MTIKTLDYRTQFRPLIRDIERPGPVTTVDSLNLLGWFSTVQVAFLLGIDLGAIRLLHSIFDSPDDAVLTYVDDPMLAGREIEINLIEGPGASENSGQWWSIGIIVLFALHTHTPQAKKLVEQYRQSIIEELAAMNVEDEENGRTTTARA